MGSASDSDVRKADSGAASRRWLFGDAVLDERSLELVIEGRPVELDRKPLEVLLHLLNHAGEVVTKDELLAAVWPGRILSDSALTSTVARLREVLRDDDQAIIKTVHGYGYRLVAPVKIEASGSAPAHFNFRPGDHAPLRPLWSLVERLGTGGHGEAWLLRHDKTREERVYKFALDESCIPSLKREITVSRLLHDSLGERGRAYARVLEWNLDQQPFFIECEYAASGSLVKWALAQGGLDQVPLATRINLAIQIAEALAAAHSVDVLHKDLKPSNVLIELDPQGQPRVKLCDFGSGGVLDLKRLEELGITRMGFTRTIAEGTTSGTPVYFSPEVLSGQPATKQSDIYALGVILYQLVVGDLRRPLALGWEQDVEDELLREDIAATAAGKPQRRLTEAAELARRLRTLDARRAARAAKIAMTVAPPPERAPGAGGSKALVAAGLVATAIAGLAALALWRPSTPVPASPVSVAVLPFTNASNDVEQDYFSDGLSDELTTALLRVPGLQVAPKSSAFAYKGKNVGISQIGLELKVQTVLTGTFSRLNDTSRLSVRLQEVADGKTLWSESYEAPVQDVFGMLEDAAKAVVRTLGLKLPDDARLVQQGTTNIAAYEAYLRAGSYAGTVTDNAKYIAFLEQAVTLDSNFAKAWSWLGAGYLMRIHFIAPGDLVALRKGFAAAERAASLDPQLIDARMTRAGLLFTPANGFAAEQSFKEAKHVLALATQAPSGSLLGMDDRLLGGWAWTQIGTIYWHWGLLEENEKLARWAIGLEPDNPKFQEGLGSALVFQGKYEEGLEWIEKTPRTLVTPFLWYWKTTWALLELGRKPEAAARIDEFFRTNKDSAGIVTSMGAVLAALDGRAAEVDGLVRELDKIDRRFGHFHHTAYNLGMAYALLNRRKEALEWLDWSAKHGFPCYELFKQEPFLNNLRDDPQFKELLEYTRQQAEKIRALGLPEPSEWIPRA